MLIEMLILRCWLRYYWDVLHALNCVPNGTPPWASVHWHDMPNWTHNCVFLIKIIQIWENFSFPCDTFLNFSQLLTLFSGNYPRNLKKINYCRTWAFGEILFVNYRRISIIKLSIIAELNCVQNIGISQGKLKNSIISEFQL